MTIAPGHELDAAVAKACGIRVLGRSEAIAISNAFDPTRPDWRNWYAHEQYEYIEPSIPFFGFNPLPMYSTDLNAAFEAATTCPGVDGIHIERTKTLEWYANISGSIAYETTPALAICSAILALKGDKCPNS